MQYHSAGRYAGSPGAAFSAQLASMAWINSACTNVMIFVKYPLNSWVTNLLNL
jgi:hypothetical protein